MSEFFAIHLLTTLFCTISALIMGFSFGRLIGRLEKEGENNER